MVGSLTLTNIPKYTLKFSLSKVWYTVKPVLGGHSWGVSKVTSQERWPLKRGSVKTDQSCHQMDCQALSRNTICTCIYTYICLYVNKQFDRSYCTMLHLFDDLWLDKIIPKNNDEGRAIYGNLENKINTLYWPVENSIPKNNDRSRL